MTRLLKAAIISLLFTVFMPGLLLTVQASTTVWSLERYLTWYSPEVGYPSSGVSQNAITIIENGNTRFLEMANRTNANQGIDIRYGAGGLVGRVVAQGGDSIVVTGRVLDPNEGTEVRVQRLPGNDLLGYSSPNEDGTFEVAFALTQANANGFTGMRVLTNGTEGFVVYNVIVDRNVRNNENWDLELPSLAEAFNRYFMMGNIFSNRGQMGDHATYDMFLHHYNTVTASNHHKVSLMLGAEPNAWNWDFNLADAIVDWAEDNELAMVGHTLVWHTQSRPWLTNEAGSNRVLTRAQAIDNMHEYIRTVAGRYRGRMYSWDVVNEVISIDGTWTASPNWRTHMRRRGNGLNDQHTMWYDAFANGARGSECGSDYVYYAFRFARIYDPYAILYYNDYNEFHDPKREAIAQMVEEINERWRRDPLYDGRLLIEGIGMQAHYNLRNWPANVGYVRRAIERFVATGARVSITELNVYLEGGGIVPTGGVLPELFEEQARRYYELFSLFLEFADYIPRVTSFIWVDLPAEQGAWRRWPHSQLPALFDLERQAKPAFHSVLRALNNAPRPNISVPVVENVNIPTATVGEEFSVQFSATQNNHAPIRFRVAGGNLPEGMRLVAATGVLIGTPTEEGEFAFTIEAENARGSGSRDFRWRVS